ncbi:MAG: 23S rRNA (uracil(1939)-C(5))-methyltransferase RlmD [Eubacteriales bacterium]|nr:23S rRNA (uracil(1939)-C(5))-methyltransferase RlmD [Eubacteriales bacterium]
MKDELVKNQIYTAEITSYTSEGAGVCRVRGRAVFVPGTLQGEIWEIKLVKVGKTAVWARGERCLQASEQRREPVCPLFKSCGGCALQHMSYEEELHFKQERVRETLLRIGGAEPVMDHIRAANLSRPWRYKVIFAVGERDGEPVTGYYRPRSHEIVPVENCPAVPLAANRAAAAVRRWMCALEIPAYNEALGQDGIRHLLVRVSASSGKSMVCLASSRELSGHEIRALTEKLRFACPEMTSLALCLNRTRGNTVLAGEFRTLWGNDTLEDMLCGLRFALSPASFFQVNPPQAEQLYDLALSLAAPKADETVLDLYCGAGTISLCLAQRAGQVIGVEVIDAAVENAKRSAQENNVLNAEFLCADAEKAVEIFCQRGLHPQLVIVDPPRKGLAEGVISCIAELAPERVVYVSCDPGTLARDLRRFADAGYEAVRGCTVDMFPRTSHVETVVLLSKADK